MYNLGAVRFLFLSKLNLVFLFLWQLKFNEFLAALCDEAIRQLIRVTPLQDVYELRGSSSTHVQNVLKILDSKFGDFGVTFTKAAITDVVLNDELRRILQGTTEFKTKIRELDKEHEHNMKLISYDYQQNLSEKDRLYERRLQDIEAAITVALVARKKDLVTAESRREVAVTKQEELAATTKKRAESQLSVAQAKAEQENSKLLATATSNSEAARIKVDKETEVVYESSQLIKVAANRALALKTMAKSEGDAAASLKVIREHGMYRLPTFLFVYDTPWRALRILRIKLYRSFCNWHIVLVLCFFLFASDDI